MASPFFLIRYIYFMPTATPAATVLQVAAGAPSEKLNRRQWAKPLAIALKAMQFHLQNYLSST